ncbi:MAG: DNA internalization-related competence protein ComEC/Rec2 [Anaerolineae bacterium]
MTLFFLILAWIAGLALARLGGAAAYVVTVLGVAGLFLLIIGRHTRHRRLLAALLFALVLGYVRYQLALPVITESHLAYYNDQGKVTLTGFISDDPIGKGASTKLQVDVEEIEQGGTVKPVNGKLAMTVGAYPRYSYGQRLVIIGTLETPPILDDFNYREYLEAQGVRSVMLRPKVTLVPGQGGSWLTLVLLTINHRLRTVVEHILPQPEAGLLQGVLLGASKALPADTAESFRLAGLTHILVVSGFNISVLMQLILILAQKALRRQLALGFALAGITAFGLLVGFTAPVVRAWLMGVLTIVALLTGRKAHPLTSLAVASLLMTVLNPLTLWSISFQLSFVATLALIVVDPIISKGLKAVIVKTRAGKFWLFLAGLSTTTIAAQLLTLPLIWHYFGQISWVALLSNLLVLPIQPIILAAGAAITALGSIYLAAGRILAYLLWTWLHYCILVTRWLGYLPNASTQLPSLDITWVVVSYLIISLGMYLLHRFVKTPQHLPQLRVDWKPWVAPGVLLTVAVTVWSIGLSLPDGRLHIYFLDVGQGDAILINSPGGRTILVDGGVDGLVLRARLGELLPLNHRTLDLVIATHGDADHILGLVGLPDYYQVQQAARPANLGTSTAAKAWEEEFAMHQIPQVFLARGDIIRIGRDFTIQVLNPEPGNPNSGNASSVVLRAVKGRFNMLLTGDIDDQAEQAILAANLPVAAYVLKVAHHGSDTSSSAEFLDRVRPSLAVISVGKDNTLGHPSAEVLDRLWELNCQIWRTDQQGTIEISTDGRTLQVETATTLN